MSKIIRHLSDNFRQMSDIIRFSARITLQNSRFNFYFFIFSIDGIRFPAFWECYPHRWHIICETGGKYKNG
jgi:hypothetical protein